MTDNAQNTTRNPHAADSKHNTTYNKQPHNEHIYQTCDTPSKQQTISNALHGIHKEYTSPQQR